MTRKEYLKRIVNTMGFTIEEFNEAFKALGTLMREKE